MVVEDAESVSPRLERILARFDSVNRVIMAGGWDPSNNHRYTDHVIMLCREVINTVFSHVCAQLWSSGVSLKGSYKLQFRCVGFRSKDPRVKSYDQISCLPDFPTVIAMGAGGIPVRREGDIFGKNAFSDINFY